MKMFLGFLILIVLLDIETKLGKLLIKEKTNHLDLKTYLNKDIYIVLNNDNVENSYLFSSVIKTIGRILDYDEQWFIFSYYDKSARKNIIQYLRICDLKSISEIKK